MVLSFFYALRKGIDFEQAFANLQEGLRRIMQLISALDGNMMVCLEQEFGYKEGDRRLTIPLLPSSASSNSDRTDSSTSRGSWSIRICLMFFRRSRSCETRTNLSPEGIRSRRCPLISWSHQPTSSKAVVSSPQTSTTAALMALVSWSRLRSELKAADILKAICQRQAAAWTPRASITACQKSCTNKKDTLDQLMR